MEFLWLWLLTGTILPNLAFVLGLEVEGKTFGSFIHLMYKLSFHEKYMTSESFFHLNTTTTCNIFIINLLLRYLLLVICQ